MVMAKIVSYIEALKNIIIKPYVYIDFNYKSRVLKIKNYQKFEDRGIKNLTLFMRAFEEVRTQINKNVHIVINCEDFPKKNKLAMAYCRRNKQDNVILIPDFVFLNWKEAGINDYEECWKTMVEKSKDMPIYNTLFWIGNVKTHPTRETLCQIAENDERMEIYGMNWIRKDNSVGGTEKDATKYVSLIDHTQYKYLIDIQGRGYSGRTKLLLFSGRPLFLVDRELKEYWYDKIVPYEHYIPVKEDLSDLVEQLNWAEQNPEKVAEIAHNAQKFALENLKRDNAIAYLKDAILEYVSRI
jgi:hypothetical protein